MPKHGIRLFCLVAVFVMAAFGAKSYFTPDSFYRYGHYRADAVSEIAAGTPKLKTADGCQTCHADGYSEWSEGVHEVVACEVCHGVAGEHPETGALPIPADSVALCTLCHEAMPARPAAQPQIVVADHAAAEQCVTCHNPHSPKIGGAAQGGGAFASAAEMSEQCAGCHGDNGLGMEDVPALAGKGTDFLARQLHDYKSGSRQDAMMNMIAEALSDQEIADLSAFYASLNGGAEN
jgi:hypothetical protein